MRLDIAAIHLLGLTPVVVSLPVVGQVQLEEKLVIGDMAVIYTVSVYLHAIPLVT